MEPNSKIIKKEAIDEALSLGDRLELGEDTYPVLSPETKVLNGKSLEVMAEARGILEEAKKQAAEIRQQAKSLLLKVQEKIEEARQKGFAEGQEQGYAKVTEELTRMRKQHHDAMMQVEKEGVSLIFEIAQKIIGDAVQNSNEALIGMIRQALLSSMGNELVLFLNPVDLERIRTQENKLMSVLQTVQTMHIKASENIKPGGCMIESELGSIDARLDWQLEAIKKALEI